MKERGSLSFAACQPNSVCAGCAFVYHFGKVGVPAGGAAYLHKLGYARLRKMRMVKDWCMLLSFNRACLSDGDLETFTQGRSTAFQTLVAFSLVGTRPSACCCSETFTSEGTPDESNRFGSLLSNLRSQCSDKVLCQLFLLPVSSTTSPLAFKILHFLLPAV